MTGESRVQRNKHAIGLKEWARTSLLWSHVTFLEKDVGRGSAVFPFTHSGYNVGELGAQKYQDQQPTITKLSLGGEGKGERLMNTNYI